MALPRGKVALYVAVSLLARKALAKMAIDSGRTMAELVEEMIKMRCDQLQSTNNS